MPEKMSNPRNPCFVSCDSHNLRSSAYPAQRKLVLNSTIPLPTDEAFCSVHCADRRALIGSN